MARITLGDEIRDEVTGLTGIAVVRIEFLHGHVHIRLQPPVNKEGQMVVFEDIDEDQLTTIGMRRFGFGEGRCDD